MSHPLVLASYVTAAGAALGARALHGLGIAREQISVVARSHEEEGALAEQMDASPGAEIEDSRPAARLGELGAQVLAAIALVMPGIGPIVTAGPLSADLGEAAGHVAGSIGTALAAAGLPEATASALQRDVESGSVLLGVHVRQTEVGAVSEALAASGAAGVYTASWTEG